MEGESEMQSRQFVTGEARIVLGHNSPPETRAWETNEEEHAVSIKYSTQLQVED